ncbi:hypothetical protein BI364_16890 [Acidihalobacter yilgarnensis]|uniref:MlaB-like STAS domain-containing protein n=1 Tax=Acidihalobacter yilgarnensis TaxID=2819280 RepID=A0A1D8IS90_9GAMM|nr:STAS domain-containing protein [Acidihalobacter yilgarnensis]AOU99380.1 hypothetical protein BI364_16890 [Acidihalobacter yilgarnensis]
MAEPVALYRVADGTVHLHGELDAAGVPALNARLQSLRGEEGAECTLELDELELLDAAAVIGMLELIRGLMADKMHVTVLHAPQTLAHTLYRVGELERHGLRLIDPREEEPYG